MASQVDQNEERLGTLHDVQKRVGSFIRKYHRIQLIQGLLVFLLIAFLLFFGLSIFNEWQHTETQFRKIVFWLFIGVNVLFLVFAVAVPLFKYLGWRGNLSYLKAADIIADGYPKMQDTLRNLLELGEQLSPETDISLILASIDEREGRLKWFKFDKVLPYSRLKVPAYVLTLVLIGIIISTLVWPSFIQNGYSRTIEFNKVFEEENSLAIHLLNDSLKVAVGEAITVRASSSQTDYMGPVYIKMGATLLQMELEDKEWKHTFEAVNGPISFVLNSGLFVSEPFLIEAIPVPEMLQMTLQVDPPAYTGIDRSTYYNSGDLLVAEGSKVSWELETQNTDQLDFFFGEDTLSAKEMTSGYSHQELVKDNQPYGIRLHSHSLNRVSAFTYSIETIPDRFPGIESAVSFDSIFMQQAFIQANIEDDYGFTSLIFTVLNGGDHSVLWIDTLQISPSNKFQKVYYAVNLQRFVEDDPNLIYYLSVWDNDEVNGYKRTDGRKFAIKIQTAEEQWTENRQKGEDLEKEIDDSQDFVKKLEEKVDDILKSQLVDDKADWEIKDQIEEVAEMRDILEEMLENIKKDNQEINIQDAQSQLKNSRILEKQKQIEELFEKLLDEELKELFKEFQELANEMSKKDLLEKTEELKNNLKNLEEQLDVNLELLKKLELEKEIFKIANELKKLSEEMTPEQEEPNLEEIKEKFEELNKDLEEQIEKNKEFNEPHELNELEEERAEMEEKLDNMQEKQESGEQLLEEEKKSGKQDLEELGEKVQQMMSGGGEGGNAVDLEMLRQLARELNDFSLDQETKMDRLLYVNARSKIFLEVGKEQRELELKFDVIKDSLKSLGYSQPAIAGLLNEEVFHVETSLRSLFRSVQEGRIAQVRYEQRKVMEGSNELAIRLDELVQNLEAMSGQGGNSSSFKDSKPKDSGDKISEMKQKQKSLKEQLKGMIDKMKEGQQGEGGKKEMVKMLSEREMLRQQLERLRNSGQVGGETQDKLDDALKMMEEVEKDIIYNRTNQNTIAKEEWIQTRLLEAEEAEREREKENKREATEFNGQMMQDEIPPLLLEKEDQSIREGLMRYNSIKLKKYYQEKYKKYLENIKKKK